jgi:hypothetical protein
LRCADFLSQSSPAEDPLADACFAVVDCTLLALVLITTTLLLVMTALMLVLLALVLELLLLLEPPPLPLPPPRDPRDQNSFETEPLS